MNKTIEELECEDVDDEEMKGYLIQRTDTFKEILSKYKEIIWGKEWKRQVKLSLFKLYDIIILEVIRWKQYVFNAK